MFNFAFMSKIKFPFQKIIFIRNIANISWKDKSTIVFLQQLTLIFRCL
jgi:hypothetical protein